MNSQVRDASLFYYTSTLEKELCLLYSWLYWIQIVLSKNCMVQHPNASVRCIYSIVIQDKQSNGSFTWNNSIDSTIHSLYSSKYYSYMFQTHSFKHQFSTKCESIMFDKRYYTISHHCYAQSNTTHIILIIQYFSYGCIHIDSNCSMWMKNKRLWLIEAEQNTIWKQS